ncbi:recombinase family protein [Amycolatopsis sp. NPDC101161]|uniref:recombinase family protein n=1 Tax=Amycolatopsis sp. NPDC101161 TaxID=3363940 RepID=UPI0038163692
MEKNSLNRRVMKAAQLPPELDHLDPDELSWAVAYYRVSTSEQANTSYDDDGFSIQAQREAAHRKADDLSSKIVQEFVDRGKSARTANRPELKKLLAYLSEHREVRYVIVHKLDRLARNREDDVQINMVLAKLGVKLVSCTENIDETPGGKLVHGIMASIAEFYSGNLSEEARKGLRKKVEIGGTPGKAPLGYLNIRDKRKGKDIGLVVIDDVMGPIIRRAFELYATGEYTLGSLTDECNAMGLRMPETKSLPERPIQTQHMHRILRNPYYIGVLVYGGVMYEGGHEALIDEHTFDVVQAVLTARNLNKDKRRKAPHALKGALHCAQCGRRLGISAPKNRYGVTYPYFYCLGRQQDTDSCDQPYVAVADVEAHVGEYLNRNVRVMKPRLEEIKRSILANFQGHYADNEAKIAEFHSQIQSLRQRAKKNKEAYFAEALSLDDFKAEQDQTAGAIKAAEQSIARLTVDLEAVTERLEEACSLLVDPQRVFQEAPQALRLMFINMLFEKLWVFGPDVVGCELRSGYRELLTAEARLDLDREAAEIVYGEPTDVPAQPTYYRQRTPLSDGDSAEDELSLLARLWGVERPTGELPVDSKNPAPPAVGRGSNFNHLVGLTGFEPATPCPNRQTI